MKKLTLVLTSALSLGMLIPSAWAHAASCEKNYIVQRSETVSKLAIRFFGDASAYQVIVFATNKLAADDRSFTTIRDPDRISVGQRLCIPSKKDATELLQSKELRAFPASASFELDDSRSRLNDSDYRPVKTAEGSISKQSPRTEVVGLIGDIRVLERIENDQHRVTLLGQNSEKHGNLPNPIGLNGLLKKYETPEKMAWSLFGKLFSEQNPGSSEDTIGLWNQLFFDSETKRIITPFTHPGLYSLDSARNIQVLNLSDDQRKTIPSLRWYYESELKLVPKDNSRSHDEIIKALEEPLLEIVEGKRTFSDLLGEAGARLDAEGYKLRKNAAEGVRPFSDRYFHDGKERLGHSIRFRQKGEGIDSPEGVFEVKLFAKRDWATWSRLEIKGYVDEQRPLDSYLHFSEKIPNEMNPLSYLAKATGIDFDKKEPVREKNRIYDLRHEFIVYKELEGEKTDDIYLITLDAAKATDFAERIGRFIEVEIERMIPSNPETRGGDLLELKRFSQHWASAFNLIPSTYNKGNRGELSIARESGRLIRFLTQNEVKHQIRTQQAKVRAIQSTLLKYGLNENLAEIDQPIKHITFWVSEVEKVMSNDVRVDQDAFINALVKDSSPRRVMFYLEEVLDFYSEHSRIGKHAKKALSVIKNLEDSVGQYKDAKELLKQVNKLVDAYDGSAADAIPMSVLETLKLRAVKNSEESLQNLKKLLRKEWAMDSKRRMKGTEKIMAHVKKMDSGGEDTILFIKDTLQRFSEKMRDTNYDMNEIEDGVHEVRRRLREIMYFMWAMDGLVELDLNWQPVDRKEYWSIARIDSTESKAPYNRLFPIDYGAERVVRTPSSMYLMLARNTGFFGDLKDRGALLEALISLFSGLTNEPETAAIKLTPGDSLDEIRKKAGRRYAKMRSEGFFETLANSFQISNRN